MKVAIIGAGLAGLSCANVLERYGIEPVIFERNSYIGGQYSHASAILEIISRPIKDVLVYFQSLGLNIKPIGLVKKIVHNAPHKKTVIRGNLGYFFKRGRDTMSFEKQLYSTLKKSEVRLNVLGDYIELAPKYDHVVIANGNYGYTKELGCWQERVTTYVRGATVLGSFDPETLIVWINNDYCKNGYAYLTPISEKYASVALIVTDTGERDIDHFWELFLYTEKIKYTIVEEFKLSHSSAHVYPHKVGNIYIAGDAAGIVDPFLGFGQTSSVTMGAMAARSIALGEDYHQLIKPIIQKNIDLYEFRKVFNAATNLQYDILMTTIGLPGIKHLLYYTPINVSKVGAAILKKLPLKRKYEIIYSTFRK